MSTTAMTLATAPRELDGLVKIGRFNARILAQEGGLFPTEEAKSAFMQFSNEEQAAELLKMIKAHDAKKGGSKAAAGAVVRTPANGTKAGGKKPAETEETASAPATRAPATGTGTAAAPGENAAKMLKSIQALETSYAGIEGAINNVGEQLAMQQESIRHNTHMTLLGVGVILQVAEQVLQAPQAQILQMAFEDMPTLLTNIKKYMPPDESDGTAVGNEEDDAGNE